MYIIYIHIYTYIYIYILYIYIYILHVMHLSFQIKDHLDLCILCWSLVSDTIQQFFQDLLKRI